MNCSEAVGVAGCCTEAAGAGLAGVLGSEPGGTEEERGGGAGGGGAGPGVGTV